MTDVSPASAIVGTVPSTRTQQQPVNKSYVPPFLRGVARANDGMAAIKADYLIQNAPAPPPPNDDAAESATNPASSTRPRVDDRDTYHDSKRQRTEGGGAKKLTKEEKKARSGSNKSRRFKAIHDEINICWSFAGGMGCFKGDECKMSHDLDAYLRIKDIDVNFPSRDKFHYSTEAPYVLPAHLQNPFANLSIADDDPSISEKPIKDVSQSIDLSTTCPVFEALGYCPQAWKCRFLGGHIEHSTIEGSTTPRWIGEDDGTLRRMVPPEVVGGWKIKVDNEKKKRVEEEGKEGEMNNVKNDDLKALSKKTFEYPLSEKYLKKIDPDSIKFLHPKAAAPPPPSQKAATMELDEESMMNAMDAEETQAMTETKPQPESEMTGAEDGGDDVPTRPIEKKTLEWRGKTYLAPLTTVGNLPFRRLCVDYGADITCGEMALGQSLTSGSKEEWALTKRHRSERNFGVQVCGGKPGFMVPTAEAVRKLVGEGEGNGVDFVDVNLGCPIDLVFQKGAGSALLDNAGKLGKILTGMNQVLGDIPLTVKFRTGVSSKNVAHKLMPRFANEWGISAMTLHGRSRQQRYAKLADWDYIRECVGALRASCSDSGVPTPPIFGNGDCFSAQQYYDEMEHSGVDGVMVARGALIKPWIFTEIQEKREWDISATERLEGYRKYAEFGLSHWGSDTKGVNTTRRFLCEAISFQHRYIPIGLLERMPPMMNERPPAFRGRSELETLLSSAHSADWVKISEMFLGKCPEDFLFNPKHKSNAYGAEEGNG